MVNSKAKLGKSEGRAKLSLDFDMNTAALSSPEPDPDKIEQISKLSGFASRTKPKTGTNSSSESSGKNEPAVPKPRKRRKTGRTYPFNTKIRPEAYELLGKLADQLTESEFRPVSMAEVLERALKIFDESLKA